jgi:chemotaxis protein MotB
MMNAAARPTFDVAEDDSETPAQAASIAKPGDAPDTRRAQMGVAPGGAAVKASPKPGDETEVASAAGATPASVAELQAALARKERASFEKAAQQIRDQVAGDPALADLGRQLAVDITPEGLRIQILDEDKQAMFPSGSAVLSDRARTLLMKLPERLSITGHTDASPYRGGDRSNWELSAERANATRRLLAEAGLPESRVQTVSGQADRDPLLPAEPLAAANRRIAIVVLRAATAHPNGP